MMSKMTSTLSARVSLKQILTAVSFNTWHIEENNYENFTLMFRRLSPNNTGSKCNEILNDSKCVCWNSMSFGINYPNFITFTACVNWGKLEKVPCTLVWSISYYLLLLNVLLTAGNILVIWILAAWPQLAHFVLKIGFALAKMVG